MNRSNRHRLNFGVVVFFKEKRERENEEYNKSTWMVSRNEVEKEKKATVVYLGKRFE